MNKRKCCTFTVMPLLLAMVCLVAGACFAGTASDLQRGSQLYQAGNFDTAIPVLVGVASADPALAAEAELRLTQCYHEQGNIPEAIAAAKAGIEAVSDSTDKTTLKLLRHGLAYLCSLSQDWQGAQEQYAALVNEDPGESAQWLQELAVCYDKQGKSADVKDALKKGIAAATLSGDRDILKQMRNDLAYRLFQAQDWQGAKELCEALVRDSPEDGTLWSQELAGCYHNLGDYSDEIQAVKNGIAAAVLPRDSDTLKSLKSTLAFHCADAKDWQSAVALYQSLLNDYPGESAQLLWGLGRCYRLQGKFTDAVATLTKGMAAVSAEDQETTKKLKVDLCFTYDAAEDWDKAIPLNQDIIQQFPDDAAWMLGNLACSYMTEGDYEDAISAFTKQFTDYPQYPGSKAAKSCVGEAMFLSGKHDDAFAYLDNLQQQETDPDVLAGVIFHQGYLHYLLRDWDKAAGPLQTVVTQYPNYSLTKRAQILIGLSLIEQSKVADARTYFSDFSLRTPPMASGRHTLLTAHIVKVNGAMQEMRSRPFVTITPMAIGWPRRSIFLPIARFGWVTLHRL